VNNPALRGWFVNKMTGQGASAVDRALAMMTIESVVREQPRSNDTLVRAGVTFLDDDGNGIQVRGKTVRLDKTKR
jgi:hypothetical protein